MGDQAARRHLARDRAPRRLSHSPRGGHRARPPQGERPRPRHRVLLRRARIPPRGPVPEQRRVRRRGPEPPPPRHTGLYHVAIRYPARRDLAIAVRRVLAAGIPVQGASDHGVSVSIYLADPDGNGLELTWDRPPEQWPHTPEGGVELRMADPFDLDQLLGEAGP